MASIEALQIASDSDAAMRILTEAVRPYGFTHLIVTGIPERGEDPRSLVFLSNLPEAFGERYLRRGYFHFDPLARRCRETSLPFDWKSVVCHPSDIAGQRVLEDMRLHGLDDGLTVPVHLEGGFKGAVAFAGPGSKLSGPERLELHLLGLYAYARLRALRDQPREQPRYRITAREAEVLRWAAAGKTAAEIGTITGLTERTVNQHCLNAQAKLGAANRTQTVVEALRHRLIAL